MAFFSASKRLFTLSATVAGIVLSCGTIVFVITQQNRLNAGAWVRHTWEVIALLEEAKGDLISFQDDLARDFQGLRQLTIDNPQQVSRINKIQEAYLTGNIPAAEQLLEEAIATEYRLLRYRSAWLEEAAFWLSISGVGLGIAFLGSTAAVTWLAYRNYSLATRRGEVIAMFAHDVRTPLTAISGTLELLAPRIPEEKKAIAKLTRLCNFALQLLEDVRFLSSNKISVELREVDVNLFGKELTENINTLHVGKNVTVVWSITFGTPSVKWQLDRELVRRIFYNLLNNAVTYSPPNSEVEFVAIFSREQLTFQVKDKGIGIPEKDRANLFEPFKRGSNVQERKGTGLGLAITLRCCQACGGKIWFEDRNPPPGTVFFVSFPKAKNNVDSTTH